MRETLGKYRILKRLGKGAMGEVHLAEDPVLDRRVAIKTIHRDSAFGEEALARFTREAKATAGLAHPNIVTVYDFGQDGEEVYLAMEFVEGDTLEALIADPQVPRSDLLEVLAQASEGLAYAHARGIVHRDVKPANILVARREGRLQAKLVDFGVAQVAQSSLTQQGIWMGTLNYLAPEYLDTGKASPSVDLFAIGVIFYEVLSGGRKPFIGETTTTVLNAILRHAPSPLRPEELTQVPPAVAPLVKRILAKAPEDRFPDGLALAEAIRSALASTEPAPPEAASAQAPPRPAPRPRERKPLVVGKGPQATCLSLKVALRQAEPGATIRILPGLYRESLELDRDLTILAEGSPVVLEASLGPCLTLKGGQVRLQGLAFQAPPGHPSPLVEVLSGQAILEACSFAGTEGLGCRAQGVGTTLSLASCQFGPGLSRGATLRSGASGILEDCRGEGFLEASVVAEAEATLTLRRTHFGQAPGTALLLKGRSHGVMEDCEFEACAGGGVELESESRLQARRCRIQGGRFAGILALGQSQVELEDCTIGGLEGAGLHAAQGTRVQLRQTRFIGNPGYGLTLLDQSLLTAEECEFLGSGWPAVFASGASTAQLRGCKLADGASYGIVAARGAKGVLEACEVSGNGRTGGRIESGCSLLLIRCVLRDGRDTGLILYKNAEATLEECVVHRNARGGILLAKDASDPILRGGNRIEDEMVRQTPKGPVKLAPVKRGDSLG